VLWLLVAWPMQAPAAHAPGMVPKAG